MAFSQMFEFSFFCLIVFLTSSDSLVEQACGGESSAKLFRESDENGFRDSEVFL